MLRLPKLRPLARFASHQGIVSHARTINNLQIRSTQLAKPSKLSVFSQYPVFNTANRSFSSTTDAKVDETSNEYTFQAETAKLLDIVTNSIYTEKDVFVRELVSNSCDALEKLRYELQANNESISGTSDDNDLAIKITCDEDNMTLTLEDNGIGMTKEELATNLGTIAHSGSKSFLQSLDSSNPSSATKDSIIGQFGVGFYSAFMVGKRIDVYSRSARKSEEGKIFKWSSKGTGKFTITEVKSDNPEFSNFPSDFNGSRIVIHLKDDAKDFSKTTHVTDVIKSRSKFVSFPIFVNDSKVNTVSAVWSKNASDISKEEYEEFYKYSSNSFDSPLYTLHFKSDVPLDLKCLIFVPSFNMEKLATGQRTNKGVSLYSRKVLVESNSDKILPDWLRFLKGVVDSEDLPISLSRETVQNSRLLANLKEVITKRVLKFLKKESDKNPKDFIEKFYNNYDMFLKEGVCTDAKYIDDLAKLLRFDSSTLDQGEMSTLDEYISRCKPDQDKIYYLQCPNYQLGIQSPYYEVFKNNGIEVLFLYTPIDEFSMNNINKFNDREIVSISAGLDMKLDKSQNDESSKDENDAPKSKESKLSLEEKDILRIWMQESLKDYVSEVKISDRLSDSPALVVDHENVSTRRMMKQLRQGNEDFDVGKQILEINGDHEILVKLNDLRKNSETESTAELLARQVFDNALMAAGLVDDPRDMLPRLNKLLKSLL